MDYFQLYTVIYFAMKLMENLANGEPACKRARLESVIPNKAAPKAQMKNAQSAAPPRSSLSHPEARGPSWRGRIKGVEELLYRT